MSDDFRRTGGAPPAQGNAGPGPASGTAPGPPPEPAPAPAPPPAEPAPAPAPPPAEPAPAPAPAAFDPVAIVDGGVITSPYGPRGSGFHHGVDIDTPAGGDNVEVHCPVDGTVEFVGGRYGTVSVRDGHGYLHQFLHLERAAVEVGDRVERGDTVGIMGGRGPEGPNQYEDHVHYQIRNPQDRRINPETDYPFFGDAADVGLGDDAYEVHVSGTTVSGLGDPPTAGEGGGSYGGGGAPGPGGGAPDPGGGGGPGPEGAPGPGIIDPGLGPEAYDVHVSGSTVSGLGSKAPRPAGLDAGDLNLHHSAERRPSGGRPAGPVLGSEALRLQRLERETEAVTSAGAPPWAAALRVELLIEVTGMRERMDLVGLSAREASGLGLALLKESLEVRGRRAARGGMDLSLRLADYVSRAAAYELAARTLSLRAGRLAETLKGGGPRG